MKKFLICSIICFCFLSSVSFASVNSQKQDIINDVSKLYSKYKFMASDNAFNNLLVSIQNQNFDSNYTNYGLAITNSNHRLSSMRNSFIVLVTKGNHIVNGTGGNASNWYSPYYYSNNVVLAYRFRLDNGNYKDYYNYPTFTSSEVDYFYAKQYDINTTQLVMELGEEYPTNFIVNKFKYQANNDIQIRDSVDRIVNILKRDYSTQSWKLGDLIDDGGYEYLLFNLIDMEVDQESPITSFEIDSNRNYVFRQGSLTLNGDDLNVTSRVIQYNKLYKLNIYGRESVVSETRDLLGTYYYKWLPLNAILNTSGDWSSGETGAIVSYGSGDYNTQDSTNDIISYIEDSSEVDNIVNKYLSGDINSIASDFGFTPLDNPFTTFLLHILESCYDALTRREPVVLYGDYKTLSFVLNSEDFRTPDSSIKSFISTLLVFLYLYGNYKYFHYLITLVETARIDKAIAELGTDEFYDSDIM